MSWFTFFHVAALVLATALALWAALATRGRRVVRGSAPFGWLMMTVAHWSLTSTIHVLVNDTASRIAVAQVQYVAIASVGVLWARFATQYARVRWPLDRLLYPMAWVIPAITLFAAFTNARYHLLWRDVVPMPSPDGTALVYVGGPWFWVHVAYTYGLMAAGTAVLFTGLNRFPPPYRQQAWAIIAGALVPWAGNFLYLAGVWPRGLDPTPLAFTVSGACLSWGLFRFRLFGLVPIARDMVIDSMEDGVIVLDPQRRMVDINGAAERFTGCDSGSLGRPIDEVVPWWTSAIESTGTGTLPAVVRTEPGPRHFEVKVSPVRDPQLRFAGWLVNVRDISARRRMEAERYAFDRRVQEQQKEESLTVLAAGVAHDFNNLLTGILGNADLLAYQAKRDSLEKRTAEAIVIGAQRAADLVSKMLAYAGEGRVVSERVDLDQLAREMVELMEASVAKHCTLRYHSTGPLPVVEADPTQLRQVVLNLIVNATEAVDEGGVITVATGHEMLSAATLAQMTFGNAIEPGRYVFLDVVDNGHGMSDETMARMFDPFYSTKESGHGLGLAAVRGIVRSHQGALRVTTARGQGTRIRVWLSTMPGRGNRGGTSPTVVSESPGVSATGRPARDRSRQAG